MRAPVSVIIPTLNAASGLPACLGALGEGLEVGLIRELILTDGGSMDETAAIAEAAGAIWLAGSAGRGAQIARGVVASQGAWLLILHADTVLEAGWSRAVLDHIKSAPTKAGFGQLAFAARGAAPRLVAGWANLRARLFGLPYGDQALLVAAETLATAGGYPELPLMEDVALARALRGQLVPLGFTALTDAQKYETEGWVLRGGKNLWLLMRFFCGADPAALAQLYRRSDRSS